MASVQRLGYCLEKLRFSGFQTLLCPPDRAGEAQGLSLHEATHQPRSQVTKRTA